MTNPLQAIPALEPQTRRISEHRIRKQWRRVPVAVTGRISEILQEVERTELVLKKYPKPSRRATKKESKDEAETAERQREIAKVLQLINKRVSRMPFPPRTEEADFHYEGLLARNHALETQLIANKHSSALLRAEIEVEKASLLRDQADLKELEGAFKSSDMIRRKQARNFHPLAKTFLKEDTDATCTAGPAVTEPPNLLNSQSLMGDPEIGSLLRQLQNHLGSMSSNIAPIDGIDEALLQSQATLDLYTTYAFNEQQLNHVYDISAP